MRQLKITQQITARETVAMNKYLQEISSIPLLTLEEEIDLSNKMKQGDERARKRFIEGNLRFVISVAKQYQSSGEKLDDLVSAGNIGLLDAAERFDTDRGFKFISYAVWWIRQSILKYLAENGKMIRLPLNKITSLNKIKTAMANLEQKFQRTPTSDEIADYINDENSRKKIKGKLETLTAQDVEFTIASGGSVASYDVKVGEDNDAPLSDTIEGEADIDINHILHNRDLTLVLKRVFKAKLTDREQKAVKYFFGILGEEQKSLEEIGEVMELTRERVRQIKEDGIRKLKRPSVVQELIDYSC